MFMMPTLAGLAGSGQLPKTSDGPKKTQGYRKGQKIWENCDLMGDRSLVIFFYLKLAPNLTILNLV